MVNFLARRLIGGLFSLWLVVTLTFLAVHLMPGDPAKAALAQSAAPEDVLERRREALGLDQPILVQYGRYLAGIASLNFGVSWATGEPVGMMIKQQLGATVSLAVTGMMVAIIVGGLLGLIAGSQQNWWSDLSRQTAGLVVAIPIMISGTLAIWVFAILLNWFPATGQQGLISLVLPATVVGAAASGGIARALDAGLRTTISQPYMRAAQAKGLTRTQAVLRHALPIGLLPVLDVFALQTGYLLSGTVITENVFARQGMGRILLSAALNQDLPVVQATVVLTVVIYTTLNFITDIGRAWLDPRVRFE